MVEDNIIEGSLKYRDGKKWKTRWAVLNKLSPVADILQLQLYRDSRDRARGAPTKASLALPNSLALTTGFTLDKESHTLSLLCKDLSLILAFDSRDRLLQWNTKISFTLGHEQQFLVQMVQVPLKSRISLGPCRIHIRDHRFCLTSGTPPRLLGAWALMDLRRYGVVDGRFVWEGGTRSGRGCGVHVALSDTPSEITRSLDLASRGALNAKHRRGSIPQPSAGTIQRDAAMWLRDVGAIDICQFSEVGDTLSIVASEAGSILSPRSEFVAERRPDCDIIGNSYTTAGSSSSSGSIVGDEPGWWANTWAAGRGSMWEVAPSPVPESLYDSPRPFPHSLTSLGVSNSLQSQTCLVGNLKNHSHITHKVAVSCHQKSIITSNPMDNYDVPKSHFQHYDVPRKLNTHLTVVPSNVKCFQQSAETDSCGKVLCWPSSLMCRRNDHSENEQLLRVNGEGKMPVLDANTGTLVKPTSVILCQGKLSRNDHHSCTNTPVHNNNSLQSNLKHNNTKENMTISNDTPIYAVIDKSKKSKPRAPTPPPSPQPPDEETPTNSNPNYANVFYSCKPSSDCEELNEECHKCGGIVCTDSSKEELSSSSTGIPLNEFAKIIEKEEAHYLMMGPGPSPIGQSHYLRTKSPGSPTDSKLNELKPSAFKPGRSLSLARTDQGSSSSLRRSTSADSILQEPFYSSHFDTPDPTPCGTPLHSPPNSPFRTSTPRSETGRCVRGRPRKRTRGQCQMKCTPSPVNNNTSSDAGTNISLDSMPTSSVLGSPFVSISQLDSPSLSKSRNTDNCVQPPIIGPINPLMDAYTVPHDISSSETPILRRSSSVPGKSANRDSASSSDSGVCESPRPAERLLLSHCLHSSLPRGPKQKQCQTSNLSHQKSGATGSCRDLGPSGCVDAKSSSSGTSDISDYLDTLSLSSHSSSDHERLLGRASVTTMRPRSGREYSRLDRSTLDQNILPTLGEGTPPNLDSKIQVLGTENT